MRIYTGTGDKGYTSLFSGERVLKSHDRLHAYGDLDELSSILGVVIAKMPLGERESVEQLKRIQSDLLCMGAWLATTPDASSACVLEEIPESVCTGLEQAIDVMQEKLPPLNQFILPGGHESAAFAHIARTVCRRAERHAVFMAHSMTEEEKSPQIELFMVYLNRLSDYLFVLARYCNAIHGVQDVLWTGSHQAGETSSLTSEGSSAPASSDSSVGGDGGSRAQ